MESAELTGIGRFQAEYPFTPGNECAGSVAETGSGVTRVRAGEPIAVDPAYPLEELDKGFRLVAGGSDGVIKTMIILEGARQDD